MDNVFENKELVGKKLKNYIRSHGYSKIGFSKKIDISCLELDKLLNGEIDDENIFAMYLEKILSFFNITADDLLSFHQETQNDSTLSALEKFKGTHENRNTVEQVDLLEDILNLCSIYY